MRLISRSGLIPLIWMLFSIALLTVQSAVAEEATSEKDKWQFEIAPYLFAAGLDGTVGMRAIDMGFDDILARLDKALFGYFIARKGNWNLSVDAIYFSIEDERSAFRSGPAGTTGSAQLNADVTEQAYAFSGGYRVLDGKTSIDVLGVARYTSLDTDLKLDLISGLESFPDGSKSVSRSESWWDAAVGVRLSTAMAKKWAFTAYGDFGGGGSDLTYQLLAGVNWQFTDMFSTKFGYRYIYQDYKKDDFKWDMTTSGVYLGLGIRW